MAGRASGIGPADLRLQLTIERFAEVARAANVGLWDWDLTTDRVAYSNEWKAQLGYQPHELSDQLEEWRSRVHPDDLPLAEARIGRALAGDTPSYETELRLRHRDGSYRWILAQASVEREAGGRPLRVLGAHIDITERKRAERVRRDEIALRQLLIDIASGCVNVELERVDQLIDDALARVGRFVGADRAYLFTYHFERGICTNTHEWCSAGIGPQRDALQAVDLEEISSWVTLHRRGETVLIPDVGAIPERGLREVLAAQQIRSVIAAPLLQHGQCVGFIGFDAVREQRRYSDTERQLLELFAQLLSNLRERGRAELRRREVERRFRSFVENAFDIVYALSPEGRFTYVSPNWLERMGEPADRAIGALFEPYVHPDDLPICRAFLQRVLAGERAESLPYRALHRGGSVRWHVSHASPQRDELGTVIGYLGIARDVTEERAAKEALRASEERLRLLLDDIETVAVQGYAPDGTVLYWNRGCERIYGYSTEEALGRDLVELIIPQEQSEQVRAAIAQMASTGQPQPSSALELRRKGGAPVQVHSSHAVVSRPGYPQELFCIDIDLSEVHRAEDQHRQLKAQLEQAQKMESIGRLAGGMAHDFNNMLGVILGEIELALLDLPEQELMREPLLQIEAAARRSVELTRQLLAFARRQANAPQVVDLVAAVEGMLKMLGRLIGEHIALVWEPADQPLSISIDPGQVDQLLANLVVNARDAIIDRGEIRISVDVKTLSVADIVRLDPSADAPQELAGRYASLTVKDDGSGIEALALDRIFEPYYTSKPPGKGTGLGLSTVQGIVRQNLGLIDVESEVGCGTRFSLLFPLIEPETVAPRVRPPSGPRARLGESVLVVEDEPPVLEMIRKMLEVLGYRVEAVGSPEHALAALDRGLRPVALVSDVVMPEMNGRELQQRVAELLPGLPCLFVSGYTSDIVARHGGLDPDSHLLPKPFTVDELSHALRRCIDSASE